MTMAQKYKVMFSYTVVEVHHVDAVDEDDALKKLKAGDEDYFINSYDGDYHDDVTVEAIWCFLFLNGGPSLNTGRKPSKNLNATEGNHDRSEGRSRA